MATTTPAGASPPPNRGERRLRNVVIIAVVCVLLDLFLVGPLISVLLVLFALAYYLPRTLVAWRDRPAMRLRFLKFVAVFGMGVATFWLLSADARQGHERAQPVIAALDRFKADRGAYPERLENLVPAYLPAVPKARLMPAASRFFYMRRSDGGATLMYVMIPPFDRAVYDLEKRQWHEID
jgi:hypothetical protein